MDKKSKELVARELIKIAKDLVSRWKPRHYDVQDAIYELIGEEKLNLRLDYRYVEAERGYRERGGLQIDPDYPAHIEDYSLSPKKHVFKIPIDKIFKKMKVSRKDSMVELERLRVNWKEIVNYGLDVPEFRIQTDEGIDALGTGDERGMKIRGKNIEVLIDNINFYFPDEVIKDLEEDLASPHNW